MVDQNRTTHFHVNAPSVLQFSLTKVVHGKVVTDSKRIEANIVTNVALKVLGVRQKRHCRRLFRAQCRDSLAGLSRGKCRSRRHKGGDKNSLHHHGGIALIIESSCCNDALRILAIFASSTNAGGTQMCRNS